ncbi:hypothetical protein [Streptomyces avidinii]|uniref:Uncharacterized protein n=1 Tax=Streptomyces avidinii TaxID=1895 RepID=A0ABS4L8H6_STRAV|nr:hypothetical protein [Streptomyces avidinii]MBP2038419.1 hypothetical protein [Streptomyces avidinii]GGZ37797.1 hypothetical protein GCM10010343_76000 [Streptomyces avidinii]
MTQSGQGGAPQPGAPWGPDPASGYPAYPEQPQPPHPGAAYGYPQAYPAPEGEPGHVVGPGYEGPGEPHGYGYPPLPEAATQYIPPVPAAAAHEEAATQYIPPVPAAPAHDEAATQYIPPVPAAPAHEEAATQYIPPVPAVEGFDGLFRGDDSAGQTQHLPPVQEPVLRQQPRRPRQPRPPQPQQPQYQQQFQQPPQQQYAPPPPPPEPARRVSPAIIGAVVIGLAVVGLGVGSLLADGKPQNNDPGAVAGTPTASGGSAAPGGEAPVDPARPQAVQLDKLLADSNDSRAAVIKAVEDIKGCNNLDQAAADLRDAARQREELVTRLQELKLDRLPDHAKLSASLTKAWQSSADADNSYAAWADDVDDDKCKDGKAKATKNAADGNRSSGEATKAKESAAALWNSIATKYGLTKRDKSQL